MMKALVIEDHEDNRIVSRALLEAAGYSVVEAETGEQGYNKAVTEGADFILLDIQLSDMDGTEVLSKLRQTESTQGIPVIAVTSFAMAGDRQRLLNAGCNGYIEKPIDPSMFVKQIEGILEVD